MRKLILAGGRILVTDPDAPMGDPMIYSHRSLSVKECLRIKQPIEEALDETELAMLRQGYLFCERVRMVRLTIQMDLMYKESSNGHKERTKGR